MRGGLPQQRDFPPCPPDAADDRVALRNPKSRGLHDTLSSINRISSEVTTSRAFHSNAKIFVKATEVALEQVIPFSRAGTAWYAKGEERRGAAGVPFLAPDAWALPLRAGTEPRSQPQSVHRGRFRGATLFLRSQVLVCICHSDACRCVCVSYCPGTSATGKACGQALRRRAG